MRAAGSTSALAARARRLRALFVVALVCAMPGLRGGSPVLASGLSVPSVGSGMNGPLHADPSAVWWNPAMLARVPEVELVFGSQLLVADISYRRQRRGIWAREDSFDFALPIDPASVDPEKSRSWSETVSSQPVGPAPSLFLSLPVAEDWTAGFGVYTPFAAIVRMPSDGPQRFALRDAMIATVYVTPAIAWRATDRLSFGLSGSWVGGYANFSKVQDFAVLDDLGDALARPPVNQPNDFGADAPVGVRELDVLARPIEIRNAWASGFTFSAGSAWSPVEAWTVGATWTQGVSLDFVGDFELDMDEDFFTQDLASKGLAYKPRVRGDASLTIPLPSTLRVGASHDPAEGLGGDVSVAWVGWSVVEAFDVRAQSADLAQPELGLPDTTSVRLRRDWRDTVEVDAKVRWTERSGRVWWLGGGYHSSASPDETIDVSSPDGDRVVVGLGAVLPLGARYALLTDGRVHTILPREVRASAFDQGNGRYTMTLMSLGVHLRVLLDAKGETSD